MPAMAMFFRAETDILRKNREIYNEEAKHGSDVEKTAAEHKRKIAVRVDFCGENDIISL